MTKPMNFPERKRQRQIGALARKPSSDLEVMALHAAIAKGSQRDVRTKKDRSARGRLHRR